MNQPSQDANAQAARIDRRTMMIGTGAAVAGLGGYAAAHRILATTEPVFIARHWNYDGRLAATIRDGLLSVGISPAEMRGRRVLLKPNMVEPSPDAPHMTTHPAIVAAVAEVFRRWKANVTIGEAPGHLRDTEQALIDSGIGDVLKADRLRFADLNYEEVSWVPNRARQSRLDGFFFPHSVLAADLIVSLPKLKTHHWVGVTSSLKNMYGTLPGIKYGWPKNVLHFAGIHKTVVDINSSLPRTITVVDAIECMEGDGPIMGSPKSLGMILVGANCTAVDATCARVMGLEPSAIRYLRHAADRLGPIDDKRIQQRGERWQPLVSPFKILDRPHLRALGADPGVYIS